MKQMLILIVIVFTILAPIINAQEAVEKNLLNEKQITSVKKNVLMGLRSGNNGLVEASLFLIAKVRMRFPETSIAEIKTVIDSIVFKSSSGALQYKAYLTSNVCTDPQWFSADTTLQKKQTEEFFITVAQRLQIKLLGMSTF